MPRRHHALHPLTPSLSARSQESTRAFHNPPPTPTAPTLSASQDGALHSLYTHIHTYIHTYTQKETHNPLLNGDATPHTVTREPTRLLKGTHAMEIKLIFPLVISNKQHYLSHTVRGRQGVWSGLSQDTNGSRLRLLNVQRREPNDKSKATGAIDR